MTIAEQFLAKEAEKLLEENKKLESRSRALEVKIEAGKKTLLGIQDEIASLEKKKVTIAADLAIARKEAIAEMDRKKAELDSMTAKAIEMRRELNDERIKFEREKQLLSSESKRVSKLESDLTIKFNQLQSILR